MKQLCNSPHLWNKLWCRRFGQNHRAMLFPLNVYLHAGMRVSPSHSSGIIVRCSRRNFQVRRRNSCRRWNRLYGYIHTPHAEFLHPPSSHFWRDSLLVRCTLHSAPPHCKIWLSIVYGVYNHCSIIHSSGPFWITNALWNI